MIVTLEIENTYFDGSVMRTVTADVPPAPVDPDDLEEWFEEHIFEFTGTGRTDDYAIYEVKVTACEEQPSLVGENHEWGG